MKSILIVENPEFRALIKCFLNKMGYERIFAVKECAEAVLTAIALKNTGERIDLALIGCYLGRKEPEISCAGKLTDIFPDVRIVFMAVKGPETYNLPPDACMLMKPFSFETFMAMIEDDTDDTQMSITGL